VIFAGFGFDIWKAFSIAPAHWDMEMPGRSGVTIPIGPAKRSTGTTGPLRKNHMRAYLAQMLGIVRAAADGRSGRARRNM
jgi:hypothetical protein